MRKQGIGAANIARIVDNKDAECAFKIRENFMIRVITCEYCGEKKKTDARRKFCSRRCYRAAKRNKPELVRKGKTLKEMIGMEKSW